MAKEIRPLYRANDSTGVEEIFYPATTTDAIAHPTKRKSLTDVLGEIENGSVYDISAAHNNQPYADLSAALDSNNGGGVPQALQKGGMRIQFIQGTVQSSDNKYVQYRLMSDEWSTTISDWQGVDDVPTAGSDNLVKSGAVAKVTGYKSSIEGKDAVVDEITVNNLVANKEYCLIFRDNNWSRENAGIDTTRIFAILQSDNTLIVQYFKKGQVQVPKIIKFTPDTTSIKLQARADIGTTVEMYLIESSLLGGIIIDELDKIESYYNTLDFDGNDATAIYKTISGLVPNKKYLFCINNPDWSVENAGTGIPRVFAILQSDGITSALNIFKGELIPQYIEVVPISSSIIVQVRADVGQKVIIAYCEYESAFGVVNSLVSFNRTNGLIGKTLLFQGNDNSQVINYYRTIPDKRYKVIIDKPAWSVSNVTGAKLRVYSSAYILTVLASAEVQKIYDITALDEILRIEVRADIGQSINISVVEDNYMLDVLIDNYLVSNPDSNIPYYFDNEISTVIPLVQANNILSGYDGDSFIFVTDPHYSGNGSRVFSQNGIKVAAKIKEKVNNRMFVSGGDILSINDTKVVGLKILQEYMADARNHFDNVRYVYGNHDNNQQDSSGSSDYLLTQQEVYAAAMKCFENEVKNENKKLYYYWENKTQNICYIVLDTQWGVIKNAQILWLINLLQASSNKRIVVISHITAKNDVKPEDIVSVLNIFDAINTRSTVSIGGTTYDFSESTNYISCWVSGHEHKDSYEYYGTSLIPIIRCESDGLLTDSSGLGTINEISINFIDVDFINKKLYLVRCGKQDSFGRQVTFNLATVGG